VVNEHYTSSWYHRMTEWFGLEGTLKIIQFQPPCHGQGHLLLEQVAQSPVQPGLEPWPPPREGAATASQGNLCQGLTTLRVKNFLLIANSNLPSYSLKTWFVIMLCIAVCHLSHLSPHWLGFPGLYWILPPAWFAAELWTVAQFCSVSYLQQGWWPRRLELD